MFGAHERRWIRRKLVKLVAGASLTGALVVGVAGHAAAVRPPWAGPPFGGDDPDPAIGLCCAWGSSLADGDLTYSISGSPNEEVEDAIEAAVEVWDFALSALSLTRIDANADITIAFRPSGGNVQGSARRSFDGAGFVTSVAIKISSKAFGQGNDVATIEQIVTHEVGHALGVGHANTGGYMMSPSLSTGSAVITGCDEAAVVAAQHWYLVDGAAVPHPPHVNSVLC